MEGETPAPRERKIRRGIVVLSTLQVALGAVIIGMSFTAFAATSSAEIRGASPYWAGFMVLFTGSVGFLTWKQLSIVSIGIYTFLSTASVIVNLVAAVLTGDAAGFLKTLNYCSEVKFEHACDCCVSNITCTVPFKFPSVRDCNTINGFLKDVMYCLCVANVICSVACLTITIVGCTLGAQYSRYNQMCAFRWTQPSAQAHFDHRHNWSPYPTDALSNLPPWAPPIYYPVPNTPSGVDHQYTRAHTFFDSVDFPPPYTSREASIAGRLASSESLELDDIYGASSTSVSPFLEQCVTGTVSEDSFDYLNRARDLCSSSGTSEGLVHHDGSSFCRASSHNLVDGTSPHELERTISQEVLAPSSTESDSDGSQDNIFDTREGDDCRSSRLRLGGDHGNTRLARSSEHVGQRRHSWSQQIRATRSSDVFTGHEELLHRPSPPVSNPWTTPAPQTMLANHIQGNCRSSPATKQRANSTPCYVTDHMSKPDKDRETRSEVRKHVSSACDMRSLFQHLPESKKTRKKAHRKRRRPRNNPGHILQQDRAQHKDVRCSQASPTSRHSVEYRETTL